MNNDTYVKPRFRGIILVEFLGIITFVLTLVISFSMALNFYLNLATTQLDIYMMFLAAVVQETIKSYTLIKGNFARVDELKLEVNQLKKKWFTTARKFYLVYAITLVASLISGVGSGLMVVDKKNVTSISVSFQNDIDYRKGLIAINEQKILVDNEKMTAKKTAQKAIQDNPDPAIDPKIKLADIDRIQRTIDPIQKDIDTLNDKISALKLEILDLQNKAAEQNKGKEKNMYVLISEIFGWNITLVTGASFALMVAIVEFGLLVTAPHPSVPHPVQERKIGRPRGSKNRKKEETDLDDEEEPDYHNEVLEEPERMTEPEVKQEIPLVEKEQPLFNIGRPPPRADLHKKEQGDVNVQS
jgi:hypothetical protein